VLRPLLLELALDSRSRAVSDSSPVAPRSMSRAWRCASASASLRRRSHSRFCFCAGRSKARYTPGDLGLLFQPLDL